VIVTCQTERGDDDMRYLVRLVKHLYRGSERLEIGDWNVGK
jgi:hypothetical protein